MATFSLMVRVLTGLTLLLFANINPQTEWAILKIASSTTTTSTTKQKGLGVVEDPKGYRSNNTATDSTTRRQSSSRCSFREYPPQQYYNGAYLKASSQDGERQQHPYENTINNATRIKGREETVEASSIPDFIRQAKYLYGQLPLRLTASLGGKICDPTDHSFSNKDSSLLKLENNLAFADGTNPSILSISRLRRHLPPAHPLLQFIDLNYSDDAFFIGTILFKRPEAMQCYYQANDTRQLEEAFQRYQRGTWFILMDSQGQILWKTLIPLTKALQKSQAENKSLEEEDDIQQTNNTGRSNIANVYNLHNRAIKTHDVFDDPRLFLHNGKLWINYKSGRFVNHNPIHFVAISDNRDDTTPTIAVSLRDEEAIPVCCGRNMGVLEQPQPQPTMQSNITKPTTTRTNRSSNNNNNETALLSLVTWVDPVTVEHFNDDNNNSIQQTVARYRHRGRGQRRLVGSRKNNTRLHGTTGFLLYLPETQEYLGVGHFHRGYDRPYAVWGHHYTHVFYTISARRGTGATADYDDKDDDDDPLVFPEYQLSRLSPEFVLGAQSPNHHRDGEVIQFAPGLEIVQLPMEKQNHHTNNTTTTTTMKDYIVLSYGINDCESAIQYFELERVLQDLLQPVPAGLESVDELMMESLSFF